MTLTKIRKRDGRLADFDQEKIAGAIEKAFNATYKPGRGREAGRLAGEVCAILEVEGENQPEVEHIQDLVERVLMDNGYVQTAKAYILYREERSRAREMSTRLMKTYEDITFSKARDSDIKRENANIDGDTAMGSMLKFGSEGAKQFYDMFVLNPDHARAHREGDIHIHDLDFLTLTTTCCQIDIKKLFAGGFSTGHGTLRENQNDQHGGQSIVNFDYGMADGVRKTFVKRYRQNLARALMLLEDRADPEKELKAVMADIRAHSGLIPTLEDWDAYAAAERAALVPAFGSGEEVEKAQAFAHRQAVKETDRAVYQAMEALILPAGHAVLRQAALPQLQLPRRPLQPPVLQARPAGDRDRLHGLPHQGDRQRVRPGAGDLQRPGQPELYHHQPAPAGHQGPGRSGRLLRRVGSDAGPVRGPAAGAV